MTKALLVLLVLALTAACGTETGTRATDPGADPSDTGSGAPMPTAVPAADGEVTTRGAALVMDTGEGPPELCTGPVATSYPPRCGGPALSGWDWSAQPRESQHREGRVRWGEYAVVGTFDGTTLTVTAATPSPPAGGAGTPLPAPATGGEAEELRRVAREVGSLPGAQGAYVAGSRVVVEVLHDDGSLQAWADREYGADVVQVVSGLVPAR